MARPIRVEFPGAVYHIMARGNERRPIFYADKDRELFLSTLEEAVDDFRLRVHAYCLMPNHYHLLVETPQANLSRTLGWLQTTYTIRFNRRHRRSGHLFQGRFKAQIVEADPYHWGQLSTLDKANKGGHPYAMARPIRVEFPGAVYHIMARGNERRPIFYADKDRELFLSTLEEAVDDFRLRVHAYCLMPNHYHLLVETPQANLSRTLGWLQTTYTIRFNRRHRRSGHLFQGRFKAQIVEADPYAQSLVRYIHLNPVRSRKEVAIIPPERRGELEAYRWSSHLAYAGRIPAPAWLALQWLQYWGKERAQAQAEYRRDLRHAFGRKVASPWEHLREGIVLGGEALLRKVIARVKGQNGQEEARWSTRLKRTRIARQLPALLAAESDSRIQIWLRVRLGGERKVDVARDLGYRDGGSVLQVLKRLEAKAQQDHGLRRHLTELTHKVSSVES